MKRHADFLAVLYLTWGGLFAVVGVAGLALAVGAWAIARSTGPVRAPSELAAGLTALSLALLALLALLWAALHLSAGTWLRRYRPAGRLVALGLAVVNLVFFPFGTALGTYACWVLLKDEGRRLFIPQVRDPGFQPLSTGRT